ncbi:MAG: Cof-type HAD-IIB family hydrolase [Pseudomonadota bacterium]|nr:Cof-type HAD-IIB family hydrolase [Pseudomonadota bacterium]
MLSKHLYVSDMDGTLLATGGFLSPYSSQKLGHLINRGINFTVASARSYTSVKNVFKNIELKVPAITHDGAVLYDFENDRVLTSHGMDPHAATQMYELAVNHGTSPFIESIVDGEEFFITQTIKSEGMKWLYDYRKQAGAKSIVGFDSFAPISKNVISFTLVDQAAPLLKLQSEIKTLYSDKIKTHFYRDWDCAHASCLTIHDAKAHKGQGLRDLMQYLDYDYKDITVFGDQQNDLAMFMLAQRSVAVSNAVPELIALSTHQVGHHNEDSVVNFILNENNHFLSATL